MENDSLSSTPSESKLPLIVGILGFALGAAGLVLGIKAKGAAELASNDAAVANSAVSGLSNTLAGKAEISTVAALQGAFEAANSQNSADFAEVKKSIESLTKVAVAKPKGTAATPPGPGEYIVVKGDNLGSIAKKNGLTLKAIQDLNPGVDSNRLQIGQKLRVK